MPQKVHTRCPICQSLRTLENVLRRIKRVKDPATREKLEALYINQSLDDVTAMMLENISNRRIMNILETMSKLFAGGR